MTAAPALLTDQVEIIIGLSGSFVVPFIGFYIPVALKWIHATGSGKSVGVMWAIHDTCICLFGTVVLVLGFKDALWHILGKK